MAQRVGRGIALLFHDRGTRRGQWLAARPGRTLPPGKTRYPLYRRLGGPQGRSGRTKNVVPTGIEGKSRPLFHTGIESRWGRDFPPVGRVDQSLYRLNYTAHKLIIVSVICLSNALATSHPGKRPAIGIE